MPYPVTMLYAALLGLLLIHLSYDVSRNRMRAQVSLGDGEDETLRGAIRAHGNFIEYVPMALLLLLFAEMSGARVWVVHGFGAALFLGRIAHAVGLRSRRKVNPWRKWGTALTWLMLLAVCVYDLGYLLFSAL